MKANELMIGDWVNCPKLKNDEDDGNMRIKQLYYADLDCDSFKELKYSEIQPIPLTSEILEKNGFHVNGMPNSIASVKAIDDWSDDTYVWSRQETPDERLFVSVYMDDPANFFVEVYCQYCHADGIHVKYLHELQHALKLCGIEKTIEL